jgi:hypothetical protein
VPRPPDQVDRLLADAFGTLRRLFPPPMDEQRDRLFRALGRIAESLSTPDELAAYLTPFTWCPVTRQRAVALRRTPRTSSTASCSPAGVAMDNVQDGACSGWRLNRPQSIVCSV